MAAAINPAVRTGQRQLRRLRSFSSSAFEMPASESLFHMILQGYQIRIVAPRRVHRVAILHLGLLIFPQARKRGLQRLKPG